MDMAGNVWEWCSDWYDKNKDARFLRGGSWGVSEDALRCSVRYGYGPVSRLYVIGFRVVRSQ